jgi:chromosome segregation ATPase
MFGQVLLTKGGIVTQQQQSDLEHLQLKVTTLTADLEAVQSKYQSQTTDHKTVQTELADVRNQLLLAVDKTQGAQDESRQLQEDITGVQKALNDAVARGMDLRASQESNEFELRVTQEENAELKAEMLATQKEMVTNHYQIAELQRQVADYKQQQQDDQVASVALVQCREQLEQSQTALEQAKQQQRELETRLRIAKSHEERLSDNARKRQRINGPDEALTATNQWLRDRQRSDQTQIMDLKTENRQLIADLRRSTRDHFNSGITRFAQSTGLK